MKPSYEDWAESFHFNEDLKALEVLYQQQHKEIIEKQLNSNIEPSVSTKKSPITTEDEKFLAQLSEKIAQELSKYLSSSEVFSKYLRLNELEKDNALMAKQVDELLKKVKQLKSKNICLEQELSCYTHVAGRLYFKNP